MDLISSTDTDKYLEENFLNKYLKILDFTNKNTFSHNLLIKNTSSYLSRKLINTMIKKMFSIDFLPNIKINEHQLNTNKNVVFFTKTSKYHIEIKPCDYGIYDKNIINEYLKDIASSTNILLGTKKTIVIWNVDYLSVTAQDSLQNLLSTYSNSANFIMTCNDYFKLQPSILSKSLQMNIKNITETDLEEMANKNPELKIPKNVLTKIINKSRISFDFYDMGLFLHFIYLEKKLPYISNSVKELLYHSDIKKFYELLRNSKNINGIYLETIRNNLYEYYVNHINSNEFLKTIINFIVSDDTLTDIQKKKAINAAAYYDFNSNRGNKAIIHLEAFVIELMHIFIN